MGGLNGEGGLRGSSDAMETMDCLLALRSSKDCRTEIEGDLRVSLARLCHVSVADRFLPGVLLSRPKPVQDRDFP